MNNPQKGHCCQVVSIYSSSATYGEDFSSAWNQHPIEGTACWISKAFMEILYKAKLDSIQLNSLGKLDHVIVGGKKIQVLLKRGCGEKN